MPDYLWIKHEFIIPIINNFETELATRLKTRHRHDSTDNCCIDFGFSD
jgi:hypothetical protein